MNLAQEVERLAKLHAEGALTAEEFTKAKSQLLSTTAFSKFPVKGIRRESGRKFCGLPLWAVAIGPDCQRGEMRGHAQRHFRVR
jgi:Short C-terminal domain